MIYRIVPAAMLVVLCAALVSVAHAATQSSSCVDQTITRTTTQNAVGSGRLCTNGSALSLNAKVTLPKGAWTIYFKSSWSVGAAPVPSAAIHTMHVQGGTTVFVYDHVPLPTRAKKSAPMTESAVVVKGAKGCAVLQHTLTGVALAPNCPQWAATSSGFVVLRGR